MSNAAVIDRAIVARLAGDVQLMGFVPDGVFFGAAKQGVTRFALVSHITSLEEHQFGAVHDRVALEEHRYAIKAVIQGASTAASDAAAQIDYLLVDHDLVATGYDCLIVERVDRIVYPEVDAVDPKITWQHAGGQYRVLVTPTD